MLADFIHPRACKPICAKSLTLPRRIYVARKERGLTSKDLAELCGINATYLRQIENGTSTPSLPMFITVCQQLQVSPNYLLAADLGTIGSQNSEDLALMIEKASPRQAELMSAMIRSAMDVIER